MKNKQSLAGSAGNNFLLSLAAFLVIALGIMSYVTYNQNLATKTYSESTQVESIQKDLDDTSFDNLDLELKNIETELE
ncbi:MAG: hypothetical protein AAB535_01610 [Patescibacteria group bacterium]